MALGLSLETLAVRVACQTMFQSNDLEVSTKSEFAQKLKGSVTDLVVASQGAYCC